MSDSSFALDDKFLPLLRSHELDDLNALSDSVYGVWKDYSLAYVNSGWQSFAAQNGGEPTVSEEWGLGRPIVDSMQHQIAESYKKALSECANTGEVWEHEYECSSDKLYRVFKQTVYPLDQEGFLIVNNLVVEEPHETNGESDEGVDEADYRNEHGIVTQCAHCRKVKNVTTEGRWDWVSEWVKQCPPDTSHGICPTCFGHYYPLDDDE